MQNGGLVEVEWVQQVVEKVVLGGQYQDQVVEEVCWEGSRRSKLKSSGTGDSGEGD